MKKKIALLLAVIMIVAAAVPMNLFASSSNSLSRSLPVAPGNSLYPDPEINATPGEYGSGDYFDVDYTTKGVNVVIKPKDVGSSKLETFKLRLENAVFAFADDSAANIAIKTSGADSATTFDQTKLQPIGYSKADSDYPTVTKYFEFERTNSEIGADGNDVGGFFITNKTTLAAADNIAYYLSIDDVSESEAEITYYYDATHADAQIIIPLVVKSDADADSIVYIESEGTSAITTQAITFNNYSGGKTTSSVASEKTGRDKVTLDTFIVSENRIGVIKQGGWFKLTAPADYLFKSKDLIFSQSNYGTIYASAFWNDETDPDHPAYHNEIYVRLTGWPPTDKVSRKLYIEGLVLAPQNFDSEIYGDLNVKIESVDDGDILLGGSSANISAASYGSAYANVMFNKLVEATIAKGSALTVAEEEAVLALPANVAAAEAAGDDAAAKDPKEADITEQTVKVGARMDYTVATTAAAAKDIWSGFEGKEAAKVTISEKIVGAWSMGKDTFTLTDEEGNPLAEAKFSAVEFKKLDKLANMMEKKKYSYEPIDKGVFEHGTAELHFKDNTVTFRNWEQTVSSGATRNKATIEMVPYISVQAGYEGPVYLSTKISTWGEQPAPVLIANVKSPAHVTTKNTVAQVGHSTFTVANITVTESAVGLWKTNKTLELGIFGSNSTWSEIAFNKLSVAKNVVVDSASGFKLSLEANEGDWVSFKVTSVSRNVPATVTFKDLTAYINRSVPMGDHDLVVGGSAICTNHSGLHLAYDKVGYDEFSTDGIEVAKYITIGTPAPGIAKNVKVKINSAEAIIEGVPSELEVPTYLQADGSTMIPIRFIAKALGIVDSDVVWSDLTNTVVITVGSRVVTFTKDSTSYTVNGYAVTMKYDSGLVVKAEINPENNRMYVPFRFVGDAFGIPVAFDEANGYAIFNPTEADLANISDVAE